MQGMRCIACLVTRAAPSLSNLTLHITIQYLRREPGGCRPLTKQALVFRGDDDAVCLQLRDQYSRERHDDANLQLSQRGQHRTGVLETSEYDMVSTYPAYKKHQNTTWYPAYQKHQSTTWYPAYWKHQNTAWYPAYPGNTRARHGIRRTGNTRTQHGIRRTGNTRTRHGIWIWGTVDWANVVKHKNDCSKRRLKRTTANKYLFIFTSEKIAVTNNNLVLLTIFHAYYLSGRFHHIPP